MQEGSTNVCLEGFVKWRIEPNYLSFPIALRGAGVLKYVKLSRCPLACRAASYGGLAFSKASLLHDKTDSLRLMDSGSCRVILGGWFDLVLIYSGVSFGLI